MRALLKILAVTLVLSVPSLLSATPLEDLQQIIAARGKQPETTRLHNLFQIAWEHDLAAYPDFATYVGDARFQDRWTDLSPAAIAARQAEEKLRLRAIHSIDRAQLDPEDQVNWDLFARNAQDSVDGQEFPVELMPVNQLGGVHQNAANILSLMPTTSVPQMEQQLARLRKLPEWVTQEVALMRRGLAAGVTPPQVTLRDVVEQIRNQITADPLASPVLIGFTKMASTIPAEDQARLRAAAAEIYQTQIVPAWEAMETFVAQEYVPAARQSIATKDLPNGPAWYAYNARVMTTVELTPSEIHAIGLSEVARIRQEMERVKAEAGFPGPLEDFFHELRTNPKFFFTSAEDLMARYRDIAKRIDPELVKQFRTLPRLPYGVIPVPAFAEKSQPTAYYNQGSLEAGRPGFFYANTYALNTRPQWEMEALTLHEAVPGHHLQIALAQELGDLPEFRQNAGYTGFIEGWGLYAESLGEDLGLYQDPYSKFGQLTYEMWRAVRLVVDTGMHALGWSRERAIKYFMANAGKSEHDVVVEIDRYIVWPGQALAYKLGELKIKELRQRAQHALGDNFDIRDFHDEVLRHGAVPLTVLEANVDAWIAGRAGVGIH